MRVRRSIAKAADAAAVLAWKAPGEEEREEGRRARRAAAAELVAIKPAGRARAAV
jgi:hypothetical protein